MADKTTELIFDTETSGLIKKNGRGYDNYVKYTNLEVYNDCRLVSICWKTFIDEKPISTKYYVIKPKDFIIDNTSKATEINGITHELSLQGTDIEDVLKEFQKDLINCKRLIAHNICFDKNILSSEMYRYDFKDLLERFECIPTFCTCVNGENITKIKPPGWRNYKIPKLSELYKHLFDEEFSNAHNAEADVSATARCYFKMITII